MKHSLQSLDINNNYQTVEQDELWIASLMRTYYKDLYDYGTRLTKDEEVIKDSIQEVFISLWHRRQMKNTILSLKFYFLRAVKNKILRSIDSSRRREQRDIHWSEMDFCHDFCIEEAIISREISAGNAAKLKSILLRLSKKEKEIIYLKFYQFLDHSQIAELMSISRQSVYNLLHASIVKLRTCWENEFTVA